MCHDTIFLDMIHKKYKKDPFYEFLNTLRLKQGMLLIIEVAEAQRY